MALPKSQDVTLDTLTLSAFSDLRKFFASINHSPSAEMMNGLYATIDNLSLQLRGDLAQKYYICSLDPGIGKTSAIKAWINNYLKRAHEIDRKGVILFFDRHDEIISFLEDCDLPEKSYGVLVGDSETGKLLNAKGVGKDNVNGALILFTTKPQIINRTFKKSAFETVSEFHYQGSPRAVRIWDESMIVGRPITVNAAEILELIGTVERNRNFELGGQLRQLANSLYDCTDRELIDIPDFEVALKSGFKWGTTQMRLTAETLDMLAGRVAEVRVEGKGRVALDCIESLPNDLRPCLITDASAKFRGTYSLYEKYQGGTVRLASEHSCKRFDPLTVRVLNRSTSKETYSNPKEIEKVAEDVSSVIMSRPSEDFLVVVTVSNYQKMSRAILDKLPKIQHSKVHFLTWGRHTATNRFKTIPNVILTSLLYYRTSDYIADMRASAVFPASDGLMSRNELNEFRRREIGHHLLQAANRGLMRKCIGNQCPESRLWIMAAKRIGVESIAEQVFPGCVIEVWKSTVPKETNGIREQLVDFILKELHSGMEQLSWSSVRKAFGIKQQSNFKTLYLNDGNFIDLCSTSGILVNTDKFSFSLNPFW